MIFLPPDHFSGQDELQGHPCGLAAGRRCDQPPPGTIASILAGLLPHRADWSAQFCRSLFRYGF